LEVLLIYTLGYNAGWTHDSLAILAEKALIVDVRYSPRSRYSEWWITGLSDAFGEGYMWCKSYGNHLFKDGEIALYDQASASVQIGQSRNGRDVALMCACSGKRCHRFMAADHLASVTGEEVWHLNSPNDLLTSQLSLF
jgi:hypothetical protein